MKFQQRKDLLASLGMTVTQSSEYRTDKETGKRDDFDVEIFTRVHLNFTPAEWCQLVMNEGEYYIGGCCGNMSALQDIIEYVFRFESGQITCRELENIAKYASNHDSFTNVPFDELPEPLETFIPKMKVNWDTYGPWDKIACVWHIVKDYYGPEVPFAYHNKMSEVEKSVSVLADSLKAFSYDRLFRDKQAEPTDQERALRAMFMNQLLPALEVLNKHVDELYYGPVEGFALIDLEKGPEEICKNSYGYCIYTTQEKVDEMMNLWRKNDAEYQDEGRRDRKSIDDRLIVRRVRVSKEKGIEFL